MMLTDFGYYLIIKDENGLGFLYGHLAEESPLNVGDTVKIGDFIGYEGTTGSSTGVHLHIEIQDISQSEWDFNADITKYQNPADFMGFPNEKGISVIYYGTPIPPTPKRKNRKWLKIKSKKLKIFYKNS